MEGNGRVIDLRTAKPGSLWQRRDGVILPFERQNGTLAFFTDCGWREQSWTCYLNGRALSNHEDHPADVLREVQITPTPAVPPANAGPGCDLGRYRTGEVPQVGDRICAHGISLNGAEPDSIREYVGQTLVVRHVVQKLVGCECGPQAWYPARFDLISRATSATPPEPAAAELKAGDSTDATDGHVKGCVAQEAAEGENDGPGTEDGCDHEGFRGGCERFGHTPETCPSKSVITGPGKYVTNFGETVTIVGPAGDLWLGFYEDRYGNKTPLLFRGDGTRDQTFIALAGSITGRYVPPPEPVTYYELVDALCEAEAGLEFAGADKEPPTDFVPAPTLALRAVRAALARVTP